VSFSTDANVLLYAINKECDVHQAARAFVQQLAAKQETWILPWPVVHAFMRISTHPGIFPSPLSPEDALSVMEDIMRLPHVVCVGEGNRFRDHYRTDVLDLHLRGAAISDALVMSILREQGVTTLYTRDRDYLRFKGIDVVDPFA